MKYKWDNKNVLDYAVKENFEHGKHAQATTIAHELKKEGFASGQISKLTKLSIEEIESL